MHLRDFPPRQNSIQFFVCVHFCQQRIMMTSWLLKGEHSKAERHTPDLDVLIAPKPTIGPASVVAQWNESVVHTSPAGGGLRVQALRPRNPSFQ